MSRIARSRIVCRAAAQVTCRLAFLGCFVGLGLILQSRTVSADPAGVEPGVQSGAGDSSEERLDVFGDPLPRGAIARLGTSRLRQAGGAFSVDFSPDGRTLAAAGWGSPVTLWDAKTGQRLRTFYDGERGSFAVAFSPDGLKLAAAGGGGYLRVWEVSSGKELLNVKDQKERLASVAFGPDGQTIVAGGSEPQVRVWRIGSEKPLRVIDMAAQDRASERAVAISPDGTRLAIAARDGQIEVRSLNEEGAPVQIRAHSNDVVALAFTIDSQTLISSGTKHVPQLEGVRQLGRDWSELRSWNAATGEKVADLLSDELPFGHGALARSRDGKLLVSTHDDGLRVWDLATGKNVRTIERSTSLFSYSRPQSVAISPDSKTIAEVLRDDKVYLWGIATGQAVLPQSEAHTQMVRAASFSADGELVATASADETVRLWDPRSGKQVRVIRPGALEARTVCFGRAGQNLLVGAEAKETMVSVGFIGLLKVYKLTNGEELRAVKTSNRVMAATLSADGKLMAAGLGLGAGLGGGGIGEPTDCPIQVWEVETGREVASFAGHGERIYDLAFSTDGKHLLSVSWDTTLRRWELATGNLLSSHDLVPPSAPPRQAYIYRGAFSADASLLATSGESDENIKVWDTDSGKVLRAFQAGKALGSALAISSDMRILAVNCVYDKTNRIRFWDLTTGVDLGGFDLPEFARTDAIAFSPTSELLVTGMDDGSSLAWDVRKFCGKQTE